MRAAVAAVKAAEAIEQRRLAGAVRADQAADLAASDLEGDIVQRDDAAEAHRHVVDAKQRPGHRIELPHYNPLITSPIPIQRVAVEPDQLLLVDGAVLGWGRGELDTRDQHRQRHAVQVRGMLHDVVMGELVAALFQHLVNKLRARVPYDVIEVFWIGLGQVFLQERQECLNAGIVGPSRVGRIL